MNKIFILIGIALMLFGVGTVNANSYTDIFVEKDDCKNIESFTEYAECNPQEPNEPSEPQSSGYSSGTGGSSSNNDYLKLIQERYNQCYIDIWDEVKIGIVEKTLNLRGLSDLLNKPNYQVCSSDFWFNNLKLFFLKI